MFPPQRGHVERASAPNRDGERNWVWRMAPLLLAGGRQASNSRRRLSPLVVCATQVAAAGSGVQATTSLQLRKRPGICCGYSDMWKRVFARTARKFPMAANCSGTGNQNHVDLSEGRGSARKHANMQVAVEARKIPLIKNLVWRCLCASEQISHRREVPLAPRAEQIPG